MKALALALLLIVSLQVSATPKWSDLASGKHSFKSLGEDFYVDVPVRKIPGARIQLSFVNLNLVKRLGLELPEDPAATEEMLLDLFAWEVDPTGTSEKKWFATHYQDSNAKGPGEAQGDGRALWTGELKLERPDGKILYVDGVQKGVGPTPYAWLKNKTHRDGKQNTSELIISGIRSMADIENNLDSTGDIMGFTIHDANGEVRSMTLRVGRQTRPAHIRWHDDKPDNEKKMMDYIIKRDLGLELGTKVTDEMFVNWERQFTLTNAEDTARIFALNAFYEHPTLGNKTTSGGSIDLNGRQYLDAYHVNMTHLHGRLAVGNQVKIQKDYLRLINRYLESARYRPSVKISDLTARYNKLFDDHFKQVASKLFLNSLGLTQYEIETVPEAVRFRLFSAVDRLMRAEASETRDLILHNNGVKPAAFDTRKILRGTMKAFAEADRTEMMKDLYRVGYKWNATRETDYPQLRAEYESSVQAVIDSLGSRVLSYWITNAERRAKDTRFDSTSEGVWDQHAHPLRQRAESGDSWVSISHDMEKTASLFVDVDRPPRTIAMLKPKVRLTEVACRDLFRATTSGVPSETHVNDSVPAPSRLRQFGRKLRTFINI